MIEQAEVRRAKHQKPPTKIAQTAAEEEAEQVVAKQKAAVRAYAHRTKHGVAGPVSKSVAASNSKKATADRRDMATKAEEAAEQVVAKGVTKQKATAHAPNIAKPQQTMTQQKQRQINQAAQTKVIKQSVAQKENNNEGKQKRGKTTKKHGPSKVDGDGIPNHYISVGPADKSGKRTTNNQSPRKSNGNQKKPTPARPEAGKPTPHDSKKAKNKSAQKSGPA